MLKSSIVQRGDHWWIHVEGSRLGPFPERRAAVSAAITLAKMQERSGGAVEVSADEPGMPVIYKTETG
jgi:hypothetical protein